MCLDINAGSRHSVQQEVIWTNSECLYDRSSFNDTRQVFKGMLAEEQQVGNSCPKSLHCVAILLQRVM